jgi:tRNA (guanine-N7-)-methyltransferase
MTPQNPHALDRAFFGRRKGHTLRPHQAELMARLLPRLALDLTKPPPDDLQSLFPLPIDEIRLEVGFGGGEAMIEAALQQPNVGFIGVEPFVNGMAKALAAIEKHKLANIRLHFDDAIDLIGWLPPRSLTRIDLIHPDPWPKRRHWKRRFVQDAMVARLARILRPSGEFRFVTDIADYASWTLQRLIRSPDFEWTAQCADDWRRGWPGFVPTRYHAKAQREQRPSCFLVFRRR